MARWSPRVLPVGYSPVASALQGAFKGFTEAPVYYADLEARKLQNMETRGRISDWYIDPDAAVVPPAPGPVPEPGPPTFGPSGMAEVAAGARPPATPQETYGTAGMPNIFEGASLPGVTEGAPSPYQTAQPMPGAPGASPAAQDPMAMMTGEFGPPGDIKATIDRVMNRTTPLYGGGGEKAVYGQRERADMELAEALAQRDAYAAQQAEDERAGLYGEMGYSDPRARLRAQGEKDLASAMEIQAQQSLDPTEVARFSRAGEGELLPGLEVEQAGMTDYEAFRDAERALSGEWTYDEEMGLRQAQGRARGAAEGGAAATATERKAAGVRHAMELQRMNPDLTNHLAAVAASEALGVQITGADVAKGHAEGQALNKALTTQLGRPQTEAEQVAYDAVKEGVLTGREPTTAQITAAMRGAGFTDIELASAEKYLRGLRWDIIKAWTKMMMPDPSVDEGF